MGTAYCCRDHIKHQHFLRCPIDDYAHYSKIEEDPRFDIVGKILSSTNRRACREAGCRAFSEAIICHDKQPCKCMVARAVETSKSFSFSWCMMQGNRTRLLQGCTARDLMAGIREKAELSIILNIVKGTAMIS